MRPPSDGNSLTKIIGEKGLRGKILLLMVRSSSRSVRSRRWTGRAVLLFPRNRLIHLGETSNQHYPNISICNTESPCCSITIDLLSLRHLFMGNFPSFKVAIFYFFSISPKSSAFPSDPPYLLCIGKKLRQVECSLLIDFTHVFF